MWPFNRRRTEDELVRECVRVTLGTRVEDCVRAIELLRADLEALKAQHLSLRGRVYALWGRESDSPTAPAADGSPKSATATAVGHPKTRDELRAQLVESGRFVPGKPPVHT